MTAVGPVVREAPSPGAPSYRHDTVLRDRISGHLGRFTRRPVAPADGQRAAAVALTLVDAGDGEAALVLTRRASTLRAHAGQWALPGGRVDPGEDAVDAARRELAEEVGLELGVDQVLGRLDPYPTRSGYLIEPVVVWGGDHTRLVPNPDEVASVHLVPVGELDRADSPRFVAIPESPRPVVQVPLLGDLIHAPTAAVLYQLREVALHGRATRVDHLEQPVWAWR
ncbi:MAG TPA: CoA pyrophosphatase [Acidimicrobiales bacterium]|nr:CoA pyrophosphatase [Acidimicrobiales bacterium]